MNWRSWVLVVMRGFELKGWVLVVMKKCEMMIKLDCENLERLQVIFSMSLNATQAWYLISQVSTHTCWKEHPLSFPNLQTLKQKEKNLIIKCLKKIKTKLLTSLSFKNNSLILPLVLYKRTTSCSTFNLELLSYFSKKAHSPLSNFPILQISLHSTLHKLLHNTSLTSFRRNDCMSC